MSVKIKIGIGLMLAFLASACQRISVEPFHSEASLYFFNGYIDAARGNQKDSITHSFFFTPADQAQKEVIVRVRLTGKPVDYDRAIKLIQLNTGDELSAVSSLHYVPFNDPTLKTRYVLPAGQSYADIPVVLKRGDDELIRKEFRLVFGFEESKDFVAGAIEDKEFMVKVSAMLEKPQTWDIGVLSTRWKTYFGDFSQVKIQFMINYVGITEYTDGVPSPDYGYYYAMKAREALAKYNESNPRLLDENDKVINF